MQETPSSVHPFSLERAKITARGPVGSAQRRSFTEEILGGIALSPTSVSEAFEILTTVSQRLRALGDPRAVFPDIYAVVTRRVRDSIHGPAEPLFDEPQFISRLAGRFCELYLAALRRSLEEAPEHVTAWAIADRATGSAGVLPIQHAMLGLNAHINFDLALGLLANVLALGSEEGKMLRYRHDHDAVNQILREALPEVIELLSERYGCPAAKVLIASGRLSAPLYEGALVAFTVWRTRVWSDLTDLLASPDAVDRLRIESRMNLRAALFAKLLSVHLPGRFVSSNQAQRRAGGPQWDPARARRSPTSLPSAA